MRDEMNAPPDIRLSRQLEFVLEVDRLKQVLRMSRITGGSRRENTAEHSWHLALTACVLMEHASSPHVDAARVLKMALIHDIVEIDAGDTYCYDTAAHHDKAAREQTAATRIFGLLPADQSAEMHALWREFEDGLTPESQFARAIDRLSPFMLNYANEGRPWIENGIRRSQAMQRMGEIKETAPKLWPYVTHLIESATARGWLRQD